MNDEIARIYGKRLRTRVCGLLFDDESLLVLNHKSITSGNFWSPPGGGIEFQETIHDALVREMKEETGLDVQVSEFAFGCEYFNSPLHSIELFFWVTRTGGTLTNGFDPELQIIEEGRFMLPAELSAIPHHEAHGIFRHATTKTDFLQLKGFYRI